MKTVNDTRIQEGLVYILPHDKIVNNNVDVLLRRSIVVIHLFYDATLEYFFKYINCIPEMVDVCIISSKKEILERAKEYNQHERTIYRTKRNRGRDCTAIYVELKDLIRKYDYFCYLHDKKELIDANGGFNMCDTLAADNLWGNMVATREYIYNVMDVFSSHEDIGILLPPEGLSDCCKIWYSDTWYADENFKNCSDLVRKFDMNIEVSREVQPLLATSNWLRTKIIEKWLNYDWTYEDFPDEPMPGDGTISHAFERMTPYCVKEIGYKAATVMNDRYAAWMYIYLQEKMRKAFRTMKEIGIFNLDQIGNIEERSKRIDKFVCEHTNIYIYGAGDYGLGMLKFLEYKGIRAKGVVVSNGYRKEEFLGEYPIYELKEIENDVDIGVIISVASNLQKTFENNIINTRIKDYIYGY